jgi:CO dehydrogenase maturation factor
MNPKHVKLIVNRAPGGKLNPGVLEEIELQKLDLLGVVPQDENVYEYDCEGKPTSTIPETSASRAAFNELISQLI